MCLHRYTSDRERRRETRWKNFQIVGDIFSQTLLRHTTEDSTKEQRIIAMKRQYTDQREHFLWPGQLLFLKSTLKKSQYYLLKIIKSQWLTHVNLSKENSSVSFHPNTFPKRPSLPTKPETSPCCKNINCSTKQLLQKIQQDYQILL